MLARLELEGFAAWWRRIDVVIVGAATQYGRRGPNRAKC
jgi:hypothetical protein